MVRRATWRQTPKGSGDAVEFVRYVSREALRTPWTALPFGILVFFGPPVALALVALLQFGCLAGPLAGLAGLVLWPKLIEPVVKGATRRPLGALAGLLPLPIPPGTFPVVVTVRYGNSVTGLDEASAAFVDGWLHVEGRRTSFGLRATDGRATFRKGTLTIALPEFQSVTLDFVADRGLDVHSAGFAYAASHWVSARERPEGEPILPPLDTLPLVYRGWSALGIGGFLVAAMVEGFRHWIGFGSFGIVATILMFLGGLAFCRMLFMTRGQEDADRRMKALIDPQSPSLERWRP